MAGNPGIGTMDKDEETKFIRDHRAGVLCLVDGDRPYGVPLQHYFDGRSLYIYTNTREGQRKINCIKNNANACFVIYDSKRLNCRSVIIEGKVSLYFKEMNREAGKVKVQMLRLDVEKIGNWKCYHETCDWENPWYTNHPELELPEFMASVPESQ